jgi:hypothetical protein
VPIKQIDIDTEDDDPSSAPESGQPAGGREPEGEEIDGVLLGSPAPGASGEDF